MPSEIGAAPVAALALAAPTPSANASMRRGRRPGSQDANTVLEYLPPHCVLHPPCTHSAPCPTTETSHIELRTVPPRASQQPSPLVGGSRRLSGGGENEASQSCAPCTHRLSGTTALDSTALNAHQLSRCSAVTCGAAVWQDMHRITTAPARMSHTRSSPITADEVASASASVHERRC